MAGSFNFFRQYQKLALAALAIMAMLAFFVLPPILQMGAGSGSSGDDRQVVSWKGGGLTEAGLQREMIARRALNQFLMALRAAATGEERVQQPLPDSEAAVVESVILAREAEANGLVVSDAVVNSFLSNWTGDRVPAGQIEGLIDQLRSRARITESDIFNSLRSLILGRSLQDFAILGVESRGAPPGWQWDDFRRLEQAATIEVVPMVAETLLDEVAEPSTAALEAVYEKFKDDLPRARSATPGFKEPARVRYDMLVASADMLVADSVKDVTDEAIEAFYQENKDTLFSTAADAAAGASEAATDVTPVEPEIQPESPPAPAADEAQPPSPEPAAVDEPKESVPAEPESPPAEPEGEPAGEATRGPRSVFRTVALLQKEDDARGKEPASGEGEASEVDASSRGASEAGAAPTEPPAAKPAEEDEEAPVADAATAGNVRPLSEVREEIRSQLAREAADRKLGEIFDTIAGRIATYAEELDLAIALGNKPPAAPDLDAMAAEFGLDGLQSDFVSASEAVAGGGIGTSFQLVPSERFGLRQQRWIDMVFSPEMPRWRPLVTRDIAGNRYLSWKTEDRPPFSPPFADIRGEVDRVWRLIEARPLARKRAEQLLAEADGKPLAEAVAGRDGLEAQTVGPFTWLTRGTAPFGSAPMRSDPDGIQMASEQFMEAVFSLEPGDTAVAFNEPETICYAIRLVSLEPSDETLRERFLDAASDPRRIEAVAEGDVREVFLRWRADVNRRQGVEWKRPPR